MRKTAFYIALTILAIFLVHNHLDKTSPNFSQFSEEQQIKEVEKIADEMPKNATRSSIFIVLAAFYLGDEENLNVLLREYARVSSPINKNGNQAGN